MRRRLPMNEDHLNRLRYQTETWNVWRQQHPEICPDLSGAEINSLASKSTLERANSIFRRFQTREFQGLDLHSANLCQAKIWLCDLRGADFKGADLNGAEI